MMESSLSDEIDLARHHLRGCQAVLRAARMCNRRSHAHDLYLLAAARDVTSARSWLSEAKERAVPEMVQSILAADRDEPEARFNNAADLLNWLET